MEKWLLVMKIESGCREWMEKEEGEAGGGRVFVGRGGKG